MNIHQTRVDEQNRVIAFIHANKEKWTLQEQHKFIAWIQDHSDSPSLEHTVREIFQQMNRPH
jgi:hypothetical protein